MPQSAGMRLLHRRTGKNKSAESREDELRASRGIFHIPSFVVTETGGIHFKSTQLTELETNSAFVWTQTLQTSVRYSYKRITKVWKTPQMSDSKLVRYQTSWRHETSKCSRFYKQIITFVIFLPRFESNVSHLVTCQWSVCRAASSPWLPSKSRLFLRLLLLSAMLSGFLQVLDSVYDGFTC